MEQMTRTYDDIDVVTHLLGEVSKSAPAAAATHTATALLRWGGGLPSSRCLSIGQRDRDLELAARIGQSLLQRNQLLQERNDSLEEQLAQALDQVRTHTHTPHRHAL